MTTTAAARPAIPRARSERRDLEATLPAEIVRVTRRLRDDAAAVSVFNDFKAAVEDIARYRGLGVLVPGVPEQIVVPRVHERSIEEELARQPQIRGWLRTKVERHLRVNHIARVSPQALGVAAPEVASPTIENGIMYAWSSIGLRTASMIDAEPEGWVHWAVEHLRAAAAADEHGSCDIGLDDDHELRLLVVGSDTGAVGKLVEAYGYVQPRVVVQPIGGILTGEGSLPGVEPPISLAAAADGLEPGAYGGGILVMPAPIVPSAAGQRAVYARTSGEWLEDVAVDPGEVGYARWLGWFKAILGLIYGALRTGGRCCTLVPLGDRGRRGYIPHVEREAGVKAAINEMGFEIAQAFEVIELAPVPRPFVGSSRPPLLSIVLGRPA